MMPAMRLALVTETYPPEVNGVAMTLSRLVAGMSQRGHRVEVIRPRQSAEDAPSWEDRLEQVVVPGLPLPRYEGLHFGLPAKRTLIKRWRWTRPDVVHVATEGPLGMTAIAAAKKLGIPLSSSFHTNFHQYTRHYASGMLEGVVMSYLRWAHRDCGVTMAPSHDMCRQLEAAGFQNVTVLSRGVDTELFGPHRRRAELREQWGAGPGDLVVVYVGRVAMEKNIPLTVRAFEAIAAKHPRAKLVIVGDGPARAKIQAQHPEYVYAGMQRGEDLAAHYASGDLFLFPSTTETFGNVVTEAMASRLGVVGFDYAATAMHIRDDENGVAVPLDEDELFVEAAVALAGDGARLERLREAARQTAMTISWDAVLEHFQATLERVIDAGAAGR
jgi:glycosyltransferase involved in cell wall biosynthesis